MPAGTIAPEVLAALARGATVLTANQRAARTLRQAYDHGVPAASPHWPAPDIYALDTWFATLWHQLILEGHRTALLLNRTQEHALWRTILTADRDLPALRPFDALAELASRAWHLLHLYQGAPRLRDYAHTTDARAFQRWAAAFGQTCARNAYLTAAQLPHVLELALSRGELSIPNPGLLLLDFGPLPPATTRLFDSLSQAGYHIESLVTATPTTSATLHPAPDDSAELHAAATWAHDHLASDPTASIAIVVPDLTGRRSALERTFSLVLAPLTTAGETLFEFSLGTSLAATALAVAALDLLRWTLEPLPLDRISALLLSPFLVAPSDLAAAAEFDAYELRTQTLLRPELTLDALLRLLRVSPRLPRLAALHNALYHLRRAAAGDEHHLRDGIVQPYAHWAAVFRALLEAAAWARVAELDSTTYQAHRRWESTLDELATLDFEGIRVAPAAALESLNRIVRETIFAPESRQAPIQILGPLELGGVPFDALWFVSADDTSWPPAPSNNPLLPWRLQRELGIPGANPLQDTAAAQALTQRISRFASQVVFSYPLHADEGERRPSPLLAPLNLTPSPTEETVPQPGPLAFEAYPDDDPLPPLPPGVTSGGATVLELQAACAFRAFAERRLFATAPESREPGFDPRDRGSLVHQVMQAFWARVESQVNLAALATSARDTILGDCIDGKLQRHMYHALSPWEAAYLEVQRRRLHALLTPWLDIEQTRPPFTVAQQETDIPEAPIGPLTLKLRVDRIDLTDAGPFILDYKTGPATPSEWLGDRPDKPQLPLYAVLAPFEDLAGVAFVTLRAGEDLCLKGFADDTEVLAKPTRNDRSLPEQREEWYRVLTDLAVAFAEGDARVEPKCYPKTCQHCSQRTLCRLDPTTLQDLSGEDDDLTGPEPTHD